MLFIKSFFCLAHLSLSLSLLSVGAVAAAVVVVIIIVVVVAVALQLLTQTNTHLYRLCSSRIPSNFNFVILLVVELCIKPFAAAAVVVAVTIALCTR